MSDPRDILDQLAARRASEELEAQRWDAYRRLCGPARWFMLLLVGLGLGSVVLVFLALETQRDKATLFALGRIGLVLYALVWPPLLLYVESRRRRGLRKILAAEAPELAAKLRDERIL